MTTNNNPPIDQLVTEASTAASPPAKPAEEKIIDPAAALDEAAKLDPAKVATNPARPARRKRAPKRRREAAKSAASAARKGKAGATKSAVAATQKRAAADDAEARAAYAAAKLHQVDKFAALPEKAELQLRFANGSEFVTDAAEVSRANLNDAGGGRVTYGVLADFTPEAAPALVSEAWLIADNGDAVRCEVGIGWRPAAGATRTSRPAI
jgi:hypothetical protein